MNIKKIKFLLLILLMLQMGNTKPFSFSDFWSKKYYKNHWKPIALVTAFIGGGTLIYYLFFKGKVSKASRRGKNSKKQKFEKPKLNLKKKKKSAKEEIESAVKAQDKEKQQKEKIAQNRKKAKAKKEERLTKGDTLLKKAHKDYKYNDFLNLLEHRTDLTIKNNHRKTCIQDIDQLKGLYLWIMRYYQIWWLAFDEKLKHELLESLINHDEKLKHELFESPIINRSTTFEKQIIYYNIAIKFHHLGTLRFFKKYHEKKDQESLRVYKAKIAQPYYDKKTKAKFAFKLIQELHNPHNIPKNIDIGMDIGLPRSINLEEHSFLCSIALQCKAEKFWYIMNNYCNLEKMINKAYGWQSMTPLELTRFYNTYDSFLILLEKGANITKKCIEGKFVDDTGTFITFADMRAFVAKKKSTRLKKYVTTVAYYEILRIKKKEEKNKKLKKFITDISREEKLLCFKIAKKFKHKDTLEILEQYWIELLTELTKTIETSLPISVAKNYLLCRNPHYRLLEEIPQQPFLSNPFLASNKELIEELMFVLLNKLNIKSKDIINYIYPDPEKSIAEKDKIYFLNQLRGMHQKAEKGKSSGILRKNLFKYYRLMRKLDDPLYQKDLSINALSLDVIKYEIIPFISPTDITMPCLEN